MLKVPLNSMKAEARGISSFVPLLVLLNTLLLLYVALRSSPTLQLPTGQQVSLKATIIKDNNSRDVMTNSTGIDANVLQILQQQVEFLRKMRMDYVELHCRVHKIGPTGGFCVSKTQPHVGGNEQWDVPVCSKLAQTLFADKSVLDLGCGLGHYGKCLAAAGTGVSWTGLDGSEGIENATDGYVKFSDLTVPLFQGQVYDWVMSLEVGEHIPQKFESVLLDNIARHAKQGVVLTWAVPGQPGHAHINNRPNSYIIDQMAKRGFAHDQEASSALREAAVLSWFKNTIMVFRRMRN